MFIEQFHINLTLKQRLAFMLRRGHIRIVVRSTQERVQMDYEMRGGTLHVLLTPTSPSKKESDTIGENFVRGLSRNIQKD